MAVCVSEFFRMSPGSWEYRYFLPGSWEYQHFSSIWKTSHTHFIFSDLSLIADITHSKNPIFTEISINNHALACFIYKMKMKTARLHLL